MEVQTFESVAASGDLIVLDFINSGTYGSVHYAEYKGRPVALKVIYVCPETKSYAKREVAISMRVSGHPNVIQSHEVYQHKGNYVLIQELADGGDLFDYINRCGFANNETALKHVFSQLVAGLAHIHSRGVSHRDIKPENVVLSSRGQVKILDFGLSSESQLVKGRVGTDPYCAPEVCRLPSVKRGRQRGRGVDGFAADVFSLGVTLVAMITGRLPWGAADEEHDEDYAAFVERLLTYEVEGAVFRDDPAAMGFSPQLCRLLDAMLHPDPTQRPSLSAIAEFFAAPWFTQHAPAADAADRSPGSLALARTRSLVDSGVSVGPLSPLAGSSESSSAASCCSNMRAATGAEISIFDEDDLDDGELPPLPSFLVAAGGN